VGSLLTFAAFTSVSLDDKVANGFGDHVLFNFIRVRGVRIRALSAVPQEAEVLVPPPSVFRIMTVAMFHGSLVVTLEQVQSPLTYLEQPSSTPPAPAPAPSPAPAPALSILSSLSVDQVSLLVRSPPPLVALPLSRRAERWPQVQSVDPDFTQYAREVRRLKVKGMFISKATDEELSDMFKEMHVSLAHKVELREAVAAWRADPQRVLFPPCAAAAPAFLPLQPRAHALPSPPPSPEQALQAVEREGAAEAERQRKIREEEERKAAAKALDPKVLFPATAHSRAPVSLVFAGCCRLSHPRQTRHP